VLGLLKNRDLTEQVWVIFDCFMWCLCVTVAFMECSLFFRTFGDTHTQVEKMTLILDKLFVDGQVA